LAFNVFPHQQLVQPLPLSPALPIASAALTAGTRLVLATRSSINAAIPDLSMPAFTFHIFHLPFVLKPFSFPNIKMKK
jgi:hypothetical protein